MFSRATASSESVVFPRNVGERYDPVPSAFLDRLWGPFRRKVLNPYIFQTWNRTKGGPPCSIIPNFDEHSPWHASCGMPEFSVPKAKEWLLAEGFEIVISLQETKFHELERRQWPKEWVPIPLTDWHPPTKDDVIKFLKTIKDAADRGVKVLWHCKHGNGRAAYFAAVLRMTAGMPADEAIAAADWRGLKKTIPLSFNTILTIHYSLNFKQRDSLRRLGAELPVILKDLGMENFQIEIKKEMTPPNRHVVLKEWPLPFNAIIKLQRRVQPKPADWREETQEAWLQEAVG